jgi:hypothetical protein
MVTLICALLQLCVEAVPQSGMFMLIMLFVETQFSDERGTDMLFISIMEYE